LPCLLRRPPAQFPVQCRWYCYLVFTKFCFPSRTYPKEMLKTRQLELVFLIQSHVRSPSLSPSSRVCSFSWGVNNGQVALSAVPAFLTDLSSLKKRRTNFSLLGPAPPVRPFSFSRRPIFLQLMRRANFAAGFFPPLVLTSFSEGKSNPQNALLFSVFLFTPPSLSVKSFHAHRQCLVPKATCCSLPPVINHRNRILVWGKNPPSEFLAVNLSLPPRQGKCIVPDNVFHFFYLEGGGLLLSLTFSPVSTLPS